MGDHDEICSTKLALGIGLGISLPKLNQEKPKDALCLNLSLGLQASSSRITSDSHKNSSNNDDHDENNNNNGSRKKPRLSKEQTSILEDEFKEHSTINNAQKHELAVLLDLRPRQVEVWFQNRRARTKLKQLEIDCERWKKRCEELTVENRQLKKEIEELRRLRGGERHHCLLR